MMMPAYAAFAFAVALNFVMLVIAAYEFRRYRVSAQLFSGGAVVALLGWTAAEVAAMGRFSAFPVMYDAIMGAIGISVITDSSTGYVLDIITLPSCAFAGLIAATTSRGAGSAMGVIAASGAMLVLYTATRGRGLGLGDVKLAAAIGLLLGAEAGLISLGVAFVFGGSVAAFLMLSGKSGKTAMPFAPCMAAGTMTVLAFVNA